MVKVLIACEFSGRVRDAFAKKGHQAVSVDLIPSDSDGWHYRGNIIKFLKRYPSWDLMIAFPPCTHLSKVGAAWWPQWMQNGLQQQSVDFFLDLYEQNIPKIAIENPVGLMSTLWRKPTQYIEPYQFGEPWKKKTCLWLKGLPQLQPSNVVEPIGHWVDGGTFRGKSTLALEGSYQAHKTVTHVADANSKRSHERSKTFLGIAKAMADQWG